MKLSIGIITCTEETEILKEIIQRNFVIDVVKINYLRLIFLYQMGSDKIIVKHFQWLGWPDHGVPDPQSYSSLLFFVKQILDYKKEKRESIIIHCR